jgi:hypothetical protein
MHPAQSSVILPEVDPKEQLRTAYPEIDDFFATKRTYDPIGLFSNALYERYAG